MKYESVAADHLTTDQIAAWERLQRAHNEFDSPFFHPAFTQAVAAVRPRTEVAILSTDDRPVGFLPYHRCGANAGYPVAATLTDFQGVVIESDRDFSAAELVRECGLSVLHLDHVLVSQRAFTPYYWGEAPSPFMDLAQGFETYRHTRARPQSDELKHTLRKSRKIERELGPLRFEPFCSDERVLATLLEWKSRQYRQTSSRDLFDSRPWTVELLRLLMKQRSDDFAGMLSALYVGDRLASVHMGLLSRGVLHWWFPAYDVEFRRYSPGLLHLVRAAQQADSLGIKRIDLGRGPEAFKQSFMSGATQVAEAAVDLRPVIRPFRKWWLQTQDYVRASRYRKPARYLYNKAQAVLRLKP